MELSGSKRHLRLATYMCPSHPVELYETILAYLEEIIPSRCTLQYESRGGGPLSDRPDPFQNDEIDLAFISPYEFVKLLDAKNEYVELLPVAAVFAHPKNTQLSPNYWADIIIHRDYKKHVKEFQDLRGCIWAYSSDKSLSGNVIVLKTLRELGENPSFFGNVMQTGSHLNSVQWVLSKKAEAASVDANTLSYNKRYLQDSGRDIEVLDSLGPLPPYPIVVNSRLDADLKRKIAESLLQMTQVRLWGERLKKFGIVKFTGNSVTEYDPVRELTNAAKVTTLGVRYY